MAQDIPQHFVKDELPDFPTAEKAIIGTLILEGSFNARVSKTSMIKPDEFKSEKAKLLFTYFLYLAERKETFKFYDFDIEHNELFLRDNDIPVEYLMDCVECLSIYNLEQSVEVFRRKKVLESMKDAWYSIDLDDSNPDKFIADVEKIKEEYYSIIEDVGATFLSDISNEAEVSLPPIPTPYLPALEEVLWGGFQRGQSYIVVAPSGYGKSSFGITVAEETAKPISIRVGTGEQVKMGYKVLFVSIEMKKERIYWRFASKATGLNSKLLNRPELAKDEFRRKEAIEGRQKAKDMFKNYYLKIADGVNQHDKIIELIDTQSKMGNVDMVIIDYIGLVGNDKAKDDWQRASKFAEAMLSLTKKHNFVNIELAQYTKGNSESGVDERGRLGKKGMYEIAGGAAVAQSADCIIALYQTEAQIAKEQVNISNKIQSQSCLKLLKNRDDVAIEGVVMDWNKARNSFRQAEIF